MALQVSYSGAALNVVSGIYVIIYLQNVASKFGNEGEKRVN